MTPRPTDVLGQTDAQSPLMRQHSVPEILLIQPKGIVEALWTGVVEIKLDCDPPSCANRSPMGLTHYIFSTPEPKPDVSRKEHQYSSGSEKNPSQRLSRALHLFQAEAAFQRQLVTARTSTNVSADSSIISDIGVGNQDRFYQGLRQWHQFQELTAT